MKRQHNSLVLRRHDVLLSDEIIRLSNILCMYVVPILNSMCNIFDDLYL